MRKPSAVIAALALSAAVIVALSLAGVFLKTRPGERGSPEVSAERGTPWFEEAGPASHIDFLPCSGSVGNDFFFPQIMGRGCALFDFDQDGDLDLFFIEARPGLCNASGNRLYRNDGKGTFEDVSARSGLDFAAVGMGIAVGDIDNDGYPDLYVSTFGPDQMFLNHAGDGTFVDITAAAGINNPHWGTACSFVDYDRDGWLDLVVVNYVDYHPSQRCAEPNGRPDYCNPKLLRGTSARLYHNETGRAPNAGGAMTPQVRFRDASLESHLALKAGPGLGVVCADFNGDRWPDIFVANDGAPNFLWINRQDGTFREEAVLYGLAFDSLGRPQANMGIALGDVDGDGGIDLVVTHLGGEGSALYLKRGEEGFEESAAACRLWAPSFPTTGFGTALADFDHDGALDLAIVNGRVKRRDGAVFPEFSPDGRAISSAAYWAAYAERNQLYVNDGHGRFYEFDRDDEPLTRGAGVARGLAAGDIDNDGDLDLIVTYASGPARVFFNKAEKKGHWLAVRAVAPALGGRDAVGATVTIIAGARRWVRLVNPAGSYLSSSDPRAYFGLGPVETIDRIEVVWPDGSDESFAGGGVDRLVTLEHGRGAAP